MPSACHTEQLDEVEALQAIYHDEVEVLCDDEGLVSLVVHIHPEFDTQGKLVIRAEVNQEAEEPQVLGHAVSNGGYGVSASSLGEAEDIMTIARRKVTGDPKNMAKPALARSESGKATSYAEGEVNYLPPLRLQLRLPLDYPESSAPEFQLASSWLDSDVLSMLCKALDEKWKEAEGSPIIFTWAEALRYDTFEVLQFRGSQPLTLLLRAVDQDSLDLDPEQDSLVQGQNVRSQCKHSWICCSMTNAGVSISGDSSSTSVIFASQNTQVLNSCTWASAFMRFAGHASRQWRRCMLRRVLSQSFCAQSRPAG